MTSPVSKRQRRSVLKAFIALPLLGIQGRASFCQTRRPEIFSEAPEGLNAIFRPAKINKPTSFPASVVDVHAHFFNARDVPIRGYLAGPVAHSKGGVGELLKAL